MTDQDLTRSLDRAVDHRVESARLRPDVDDLFQRVERRASRDRRLRSGLLVVFLAVGGLVGFAIGRDDSGSDLQPIAVASDGVADAATEPAALAPTDLEAAQAGVERVFHDAYSGGVTEAERTAAIQDGASLGALRKEQLADAAAHGYTAEQLAGTTIDVLGVQFIDEDHAAVRFTISVPGHGDVLVDRIGYAVRLDGRWKVTLRTACDLLSLGGSRRPCPPA